VTGLVLGGLKRSSLANVIMVSITLLALGLFVACAMPVAFAESRSNLLPLLPEESHAGGGFLQACALMFVAYTGYGRIATMGDRVAPAQRRPSLSSLLCLGRASCLPLSRLLG
jgi:APA family basic amino acid/polyamine antiporter